MTESAQVDGLRAAHATGRTRSLAWRIEHSFETFSHAKAVLTRSTRLDLSVRYPPYNERKLTWLKRLLSGRWVRHTTAAAKSPPEHNAGE